MSSTGASLRLPTLGRRGEGWVAAQLVLVAAVLTSPLAGHGWPGWAGAAASVAGGGLMAFGLLLLATGIAELLRKSALTALPAPRGDGELARQGLYGRVRHPMYGGGILFALGWAVFFGTFVGLALSAVLAVFFEFKSRQEETWLLARYPGYAAYRRRVRHRFVPFVH